MENIQCRKGARTVSVTYIGKADKRAEFEAFCHDKQELIVDACLATKGREDPLLFFKWNETGLEQRVATAAAAGLHTPDNRPPTNAAELKVAIVHFLCSGPCAGTDLGDHHDLIQFIPISHALQRMTDLLVRHRYLKREGAGWPGLPADAGRWEDIVDYVQWLEITGTTAVVGPVDMLDWFNN